MICTLTEMETELATTDSNVIEDAQSPEEIAPVGNTAPGLVSFGGAIVGLLAASCCALPLILMGLGLGGAFASSLMSLAPYREYFAIGALLIFVAGVYLVYARPRILCAQGKACAPDGIRLSSVFVQIMLWLTGAFAVIAFAYPYYEDWLISMM